MVSEYSETSISYFPSSLQYAITLDLLAAVILSVATAFFLVLILSHIVFNLISRLQEMMPNHILEQNMYNRPSATSFDLNTVPHQALLHRSLARYNAHLLDMLERFVRDVDEGRGQRLRALNRLPPLISYERREKGSSSSCVDECVICLEEFEDGQSCQVFPVCNHIFHTSCIDHWLGNRPTCPVCRHCILNV